LFLILLGLHQSGWVAHDYLHHSVLPSVYWNEKIGDMFGVFQGYDKGWWKDRHNAHHVNTNDVNHDPDIAIAPLLHFMQQYPDLQSKLKHIQKYQHIYYLPLTTLLDVDWRVESILLVWKNFQSSKIPALKLIVHYVFVGLLFSVTGFYPLFIISLVRGFMLSIVVFSNHYTEERFFCTPAHMSLAEQTAYTTRNLAGGPLMNFFSGNISLQIEHHLFPTMPPHNLAEATPYVTKFFVDHDLPYNSSSIMESVGRLLWSLNINNSLKVHQS